MSSTTQPLLSQITDALGFAQETGIERMSSTDVARLSELLSQYAIGKHSAHGEIQHTSYRFRRAAHEADLQFANGSGHVVMIFHSNNEGSVTAFTSVPADSLGSAERSPVDAVSEVSEALRTTVENLNRWARSPRSFLHKDLLLPSEAAPKAEVNSEQSGHENYAAMSLRDTWTSLEEEYKDFDTAIPNSIINWGNNEEEE